MINSNVQYGGDMGKATPRSDIQYYEEYEVIGEGVVIEEGRDFLGSQTAFSAGQNITVSIGSSYSNKYSGSISFTAQFKKFVQATISINLDAPTQTVTVSKNTGPLPAGTTIYPYLIKRSVKYSVKIRTYQVNMISGVVTEMPSKTGYVYKGLFPEIIF